MSRPRHVTDHECDALIVELRRGLEVLERDLKRARRHTQDFAASGFSSGAAAPSAKGTVSRPTEAAVLAKSSARTDDDVDVWRNDPTELMAPRLRNAVANLRSALIATIDTIGSPSIDRGPSRRP